MFVFKLNTFNCNCENIITDELCCLDYMWLHIRGVGEWTNRLYAYFEEEQQKLHLLNEEMPGTVNSKTSTVDSMESSKIKKLQTYVQC